MIDILDMFDDSYVNKCGQCGDSVHSPDHVEINSVGQLTSFICNRPPSPDHVRLDLSKADIDGAYRVSGDVVCEACGRKYDHHPLIENVLDNNNKPYLNFTCAGDIIKL